MSPSVLRRTAYGSALLAWAYSAGGCVAQPSTSSSGTDAGAAAEKGVSCGADPTTGVTLCIGTKLCPDPSAQVPSELSTCGFKTVVPSYDLECVCSGTWLCPVGVASNCGEVSTLLGQRTLLEICNQVGTGTCKDLSGGTPLGTGGASSTCDQSCKADCAGSVVCIQGCPGC